MKDKELTFYKLLAVCAGLLFVYQYTKKNGGTMQGKYNPDNIANLASHLLPEEYRGYGRQIGKQILTRMVQL